MPTTSQVSNQKTTTNNSVAMGETTLNVTDKLLGNKSKQGSIDLALAGVSGSDFLRGLKTDLNRHKVYREQLREERQQLADGYVEISQFFDGTPRPVKFIRPVAQEENLVKELLKKPHVIAALSGGSIKLTGYDKELAAVGITTTTTATTPDNDNNSIDRNSGEPAIVTSLLPGPIARWVSRHKRAALITAIICLLLGLINLSTAFSIATAPKTSEQANNSSNLTTTPVANTNGAVGSTITVALSGGIVNTTTNSTPTIGTLEQTQAATNLQETAFAIVQFKATQTAFAQTATAFKTVAVATPTPPIPMISPTPTPQQSVAGSGSDANNNPTLQHSGFLPPSQLIANAFNFTNSQIDRARAVDSQAPIAIPPAGVIYHFGAYGGEPGNCVLIGDYNTMGKTLIELVQQNDTVNVVDRAGDTYTYLILGYQRASDLMHNILPTSSGPTATPSSVLQGYAGDAVLFQTNKTDLNLLAIPTNPKLAVLTLVSTARPGDNPDERLAVRGVLVGFKLAHSTGVGTPVAVGIATTPVVSTNVATTTAGGGGNNN